MKRSREPGGLRNTKCPLYQPYAGLVVIILFFSVVGIIIIIIIFFHYCHMMIVDYDVKVCPEGRCSWIMPRCRRLVPTVGKVPDFAFWPTA